MSVDRVCEVVPCDHHLHPLDSLDLQEAVPKVLRDLQGEDRRAILSSCVIFDIHFAVLDIELIDKVHLDDRHPYLRVDNLRNLLLDLLDVHLLC